MLCDAILDNMHTVTLNKYGCRVVQTLIKQVPIEMVHELIEALTGFVVEASAHRHATHVIHCIVSLFDSAVYERIVAVVGACVRRRYPCSRITTRRHYAGL